MDDTQEDIGPIPVRLNPRVQLATFIGIRACIESGDTLPVIASKLKGFTPYYPEQTSWEKVKKDLQAGQAFGTTLSASGLFDPEVERILAVVPDTGRAIDAAIEYLGSPMGHRLIFRHAGESLTCSIASKPPLKTMSDSDIQGVGLRKKRGRKKEMD